MTKIILILIDWVLFLPVTLTKNKGKAISIIGGVIAVPWLYITCIPVSILVVTCIIVNPNSLRDIFIN